jgi:hypothetical protein
MRANHQTCGHSFLIRFIAASAFLAIALTACGGGYGGGGMNGSSCGGAYGGACPNPTVALKAPASGMTVSGTVALTATASAAAMSGLTIMRVDFFVDGAPAGTASASPYTVNWDSTKVSDGSHSVTATVTDSMNDMATTPATMITVKNAAAAMAPMTPAQIFPAPQSSASGNASLMVKLETGAMQGKVQLNGVAATAVTINEGFAGTNGAAVIQLTPAAGAWVVPAGALLTAEQVSAFKQGGLYVIAASAANPRGEVRGQIAPENVTVRFTDMVASPEAAQLGIRAAGVAATTVDRNANTLTIHVNSTGVDDALAAQVNTGAKATELARDSVDMRHWSTQLVAISADEVASFEAGRWQVSVATPAAEKGAIRGDIGAAKTD